jgi:hypothetical protein
MLQQILSSDSIKVKGQVGKGGEVSGDSSSQFSKILASLDKGEPKVKGGEVFDTLQDLFQDDKEFLKESFQLLKGDTPLQTGESSSKPNIVLGLNFGGANSAIEDKDFKVIINKAKEFLKHELLKKGGVETELPQTLKGLTQLAESKGIKLKDIKFDLSEKSTKSVSSETSPKSGALNIIQTDTGAKAVINKHSTEALLRQSSRVIKANPTDMTPQNLTKTETAEVSTPKNGFSLEAILAGDTPKTKVSEKSSEKQTLNLSSESKSLGDILKAAEMSEEKVAPKNIAMAEKVGKPLNMSGEFVSTLFTKEEIKDIFGGEKMVSGLGEVANLEESQISGVEKKEGIQLKIGEAKIMTRHLASTLQQQVENYKHPFSKMSLILQPEKLGEIEVDIFKRGNSVKISLSGNSQTMGILSANQFELRNQLMSVGLENASFKFNEDGKNGQSGYREQQRDNLDEETKDELQQLFEIDVTERVSA